MTMNKPMSEENSNPDAVLSVVIVGRDLACWLTALGLVSVFGRQKVRIEVVELPSLIRNSDTVSSLSMLEGFHTLLGISESEIITQCQATFSLGHSFANFSKTQPPFFHPYGRHGQDIAKIDFMQFWVKARQSGLPVDFDVFSLNTVAAKQERFFLPTDELYKATKSGHGYHFLAKAYIQHIKALAIKRGVQVHSSLTAIGKISQDTGHIDSLILPNGQELKADLFIDASGFEGLLIKQALKTPFMSWQDYFRHDRILTTSGARLKSLPPYAQTRALEDSLLHLVPLQHQTGLIHSYNSHTLSDQSALETAAIVSNIRPDPKAQTLVTPLNVGHGSQLWVKNCVAIGEAGFSLYPIDNVGLHAIQLAIVHLINLFPLTSDMALEARAYNEIMLPSLEQIRDFQLSHFKLNQYIDSPYWDAMRRMALPDSLAHKIEVFKACGQVVLYDHESFDADDWKSVFLGHGLMPQSYDHQVDQMDEAYVIQQFQSMIAYLKEQVNDMVSHDKFLDIYAQ